METLSFSAFVELVLVRVAEADRVEPGEYHDLFELVEFLRLEVDDEWVYDAGKILDDRGLVTWLKVLDRPTNVRLTGEGRLYVERGGDTGVIRQYERQPSLFVVNVTGEGHNVAVSQTGAVSQVSNRETNELLVLVEEIERELERDDSLSAEDKAGFRTDLDAVRGQLLKPEPNRKALRSLLEPMAGIASVGSFVTSLLEILG